MKTFHSILPSFALGFDCICIVLAGIYTFQQLYTYVRNEDSSEISFQKFTDDSSSRKYPTYTICFEDQDQHHIYNTEPISTFSFNRRINFNPERCPCGCHVQREGDRLRLLNQGCPESTENIHDSYLHNPLPPLFDENGNPNPNFWQAYDLRFPSSHDNAHFNSSAKVDSIFASDNISVSPYDDFQTDQSVGGGYFSQNRNTTLDYGILPYDQSLASHDTAFSLNYDTNSDTSDVGYPQLASHDNTFPSYDSNFPTYDETFTNDDYASFDVFWKNQNYTYRVGKRVSEEVDFDLNWGQNVHGNEMIVYEIGNKTYIISPKQYKLLMFGFNGSCTYRFDDPSYNTTVEAISQDLGDVDFDDATIGIEDFLLDFELKTENGTIYGWASDDYRRKRTYCEADSAIGHYLTIDCKAPRSFEKYLDSRITPSKYPFKKKYQDPGKICYTPSSNQSIYPKSNKVTLDLMEIASLDTGLNQLASTDLPFMRLYIHMQGQFMRGMHKEIASFTKRDLARYCLNLPTLPIDLIHFDDIVRMGTCTGTKLTFDVSQVTLLKSRHDSIRPCNPNLKDEDFEIMKAMMINEKVQCTPKYWKVFNISSENRYCNETSQYEYIRKATSNFTNYGEFGFIGSFRKSFSPPCEEMIIVTNKQITRGRELLKINLDSSDPYGLEANRYNKTELSLYLDFEFNHANPVYQVIENGRRFSAEMCFAGIGGFIGIFVGVSLRQLPQLILDFFKQIKKYVFST